MQDMKEFYYQRAKKSTAPFYGDEVTVVSILRHEFVALRDRNASEEDMNSWRDRIKERFPEHQKEELLKAVRESLEGKGIGA